QATVQSGVSPASIDAAARPHMLSKGAHGRRLLTIDALAQKIEMEIVHRKRRRILARGHVLKILRERLPRSQYRCQPSELHKIAIPGRRRSGVYQSQRGGVVLARRLE